MYLIAVRIKCESRLWKIWNFPKKPEKDVLIPNQLVQITCLMQNPSNKKCQTRSVDRLCIVQKWRKLSKHCEKTHLILWQQNLLSNNVLIVHLILRMCAFVYLHIEQKAESTKENTEYHPTSNTHTNLVYLLTSYCDSRQCIS